MKRAEENNAVPFKVIENFYLWRVGLIGCINLSFFNFFQKSLPTSPTGSAGLLLRSSQPPSEALLGSAKLTESTDLFQREGPGGTVLFFQEERVRRKVPPLKKEGIEGGFEG